MTFSIFIFMKLSEYAKMNNVCYRTAYRHWKAGIISGKQLPTGTIVISEEPKTDSNEKVAIYTRVSSSENKTNLDSQADRLLSYANAKGYQIHKIIKEVGSGLNDNRPKLYSLLADTSITKIIVEHKDRFSRFGLNYIKLLLESQGRSIEIVNEVTDQKEDLIQDFASIITSFCARLYGKRRSKRKTLELITELNDN